MSFQNKKLMIHVLDDFHVSTVLGHPTDRASSAIHMASSLLDIQPTTAAVPRPNNATCIHNTTFVRKNGQDVLCRGKDCQDFCRIRNDRPSKKLPIYARLCFQFYKDFCLDAWKTENVQVHVSKLTVSFTKQPHC